MKRILLYLLALMLVCSCAAAEESLRGYVKGEGYHYVQLGEYPYDKDGTVKPVLWRVLSVEDGAALLLTEYVIDAKQMIFETDQKVIEKRTYRRITAYAESDLYQYLNTQGLDDLFGDDPIRQAFIEEPGGGKLFILSTSQYLTPAYGFTKARYGVTRSRYAKATPYALKQGVYKDRNGNSPYWASTIKSEKGYQMQLVGYDGHMSWGAYTRVNVGLRLNVRLDLTRVTVAGGSGAKDDPFLFTYTGAAGTSAQEAAHE